MENETIERIITGFKEKLEEVKRGNDNIYEKMDTMMERMRCHETDIQLLKSNDITFSKNIDALFAKQNESIKWQTDFIDKMGSGNKQNLIIVLMALALIISVVGIFMKVQA